MTRSPVADTLADPEVQQCPYHLYARLRYKPHFNMRALESLQIEFAPRGATES
jgi:hypothetical protein